jgi:hypothetical protein
MAVSRSFVVVILAAVACMEPLAAQAPGLELSVSALRVGEWFTMTSSGGAASMPYRVACDLSPGPIPLPGIGTLEVGLSEKLMLSPVLSLGLDGSHILYWPVAPNPEATGAVLYFQSAAADPASPSGFDLSAGRVHPIHPEIPPAGVATTQTLGDDDAALIAFTGGFSFPFFGIPRGWIAVSSNGLLTFDGSSVDPTESGAEFMSGLPKIGLLWDDLNPPAGGAVRTITTASTFTVEFENVEQFWQPGANTASATLYADGRIVLCFSGLTLQDGLVGVSPGSIAPYVSPTSFSASHDGGLSAGGAIWEKFLPLTNPNDLSGEMITFLPDGAGYRWVR